MMNTEPASYLLDSSSSSSSSDSDYDSDDDYESEPDLEPETLEPPIKRQKLSLPPRTQVCIVGHYMARRHNGYDIVVADLDSLRNAAAASCNDDDDEFIPIRSALRLKVKEPYSLTFCGLGSKLYIFEPKTRHGYAIDLSSYYRNSNDDLTKPTVVLKKRMLLNNNKIRDMHHPKKKPFAIPTPDAKKILLFSKYIDISDDPRSEPEGANDFELYDPKTDTWQQLPGILHDWRRRSSVYSISITTFTFIGSSTFFIETSAQLMFALNLESVDQGWQRMDTFYGSASPHPMIRDRFLVMEEHLCVNPRVAYDIHKQVGSPFRLPQFRHGFEDFSAPLLALLGEDDQEEEEGGGNYYFCTLLSGISTTTKFPHLSLNITSCDLSKYKRNKDEQLDTCMTVGDSIKFYLDDGEQNPSFDTVCFFSINV